MIIYTIKTKKKTIEIFLKYTVKKVKVNLLNFLIRKKKYLPSILNSIPF